MNRLAATVVAPPVSTAIRAGDYGVVVGSGSAAYVDFEGLVVGFTGPAVPLMPNGISLVSSTGIECIRRGAQATVVTGGMRVEDTFVDWTGARRGLSGVPVNSHASRRLIAARARELLGFIVTMGLDDGGRVALEELGASFAQRDIDRAGEAAISLLGRGQGLTPEGDDVVTGCAAAIVAFGKPLGLAVTEKNKWLSALCPPDVRVRTTALAATLLQLACSGHVVEPLVTLLALDRGEEERRRAARELVGVGHSTGRAWMTGCGLAATGLASDPVVRELTST
jgi:hypothetical protein